MSTSGLLFQWTSTIKLVCSSLSSWYIWKIDHLALNNNYPPIDSLLEWNINTNKIYNTICFHISSRKYIVSMNAQNRSVLFEGLPRFTRKQHCQYEWTVSFRSVWSSTANHKGVNCQYKCIASFRCEWSFSTYHKEINCRYECTVSFRSVWRSTTIIRKQNCQYECTKSIRSVWSLIKIKSNQKFYLKSVHLQTVQT